MISILSSSRQLQISFAYTPQQVGTSWGKDNKWTMKDQRAEDTSYNGFAIFLNPYPLIRLEFMQKICFLIKCSILISSLWIIWK